MSEGASWSLGDAYQVWIAAVDDTYRELVQTAAALVPNLLGAALLLLFGWLLAFLLRALIVRLGTGLDRLTESLRLRAGAGTHRLRWPVSRIVAVTVYWLVILFFVAVAADVLGLTAVADAFSTVLSHVPTLVLTGAALLVILALSGTVALLVERSARGAGVASAPALAALVRVALIAMASIVALGHVGIDTTVLVVAFALLVAGFLAGAALAFGLGAAGAVGNLIAAQHARRAYRVGQRVRVAGEEGEILELTPVAVVLETDAGRTLVPARVFQESVSVLLDDDADA
jgi:small-conductance mechanosensitive channel